MKICVISESVPYPANSGKELPVAEIFQRLSQRHEVDLLVISNNESDFIARKPNLPTTFREVTRLPFTRMSKPKRIWREIAGISPFFLNAQINEKALENWAVGRKYDWVWVSPAAYTSIVQQTQTLRLNIFDHIAVGVNDIKTALYADSLNEIIGYGKLRPKLVYQWIRSLWMGRAERAYLSKIDIAHVQTNREREKTLQILGKLASKVEVLAAPNGIKLDLMECTYNGIDSNIILYMTHLNRGRRLESAWFVTKIWPLIKAQLPDAQLCIVGRPPDQDDHLPYITNDPSIRVYGFADDLLEVMELVRMAIVPIFHGTGLINRIQDALIAGIPCVSTTPAISTLDNLKPGIDILCADNVGYFAKEVIRLYKDRNLRLELSERGRKYAQQQPNWDDTAQKIEQALLSKIVTK